MPRKTALIHVGDLEAFDFGVEHPLNVQRYLFTYELMRCYDLLGGVGTLVRSLPPVREEDLLTFHSSEYLARLREFNSAREARADFRFGLGDVENPVFAGFFDWVCRGTSGTMEAIRLVTEGGYDIGFNPVGGWHHAHRCRASGFSYINDAAVAINLLVGRGKRVAYLDIDAHHGDGVQEAFYDSDRVLTISIHERGTCFFPGTGSEEEIGTGRGKGYSVNVPLQAHADDALFMKAFDEVAFPLIAAFDPDLLVTQIGADTFRTDPLTSLEVTTRGYGYVLKKIRALNLPWVALGGGGYDNVNVARAWTMAWAIMNEIELPSSLPTSFVAHIDRFGHANRMLLDARHRAEDDDGNRALDALEKIIAALRRTVFPIIMGRDGGACGA